MASVRPRDTSHQAHAAREAVPRDTSCLPAVHFLPHGQVRQGHSQRPKVAIVHEELHDFLIFSTNNHDLIVIIVVFPTLRRFRDKVYKQAFCGNEFVDWLLIVGLAPDRAHGVKYGKHLVAGRVLRHFDNEHHFHDQPIFYVVCLDLDAVEDGNETTNALSFDNKAFQWPPIDSP